MPKVFNKHHKDYPPNSVYVGRPSKWGNPFLIGSYKAGTTDIIKRGDAVGLFREYVEQNPTLKAEIKKELKGKNLVCWCAPKACHADVLLEIANEAE